MQQLSHVAYRQAMYAAQVRQALREVVGLIDDERIRVAMSLFEELLSAENSALVSYMQMKQAFTDFRIDSIHSMLMPERGNFMFSARD